MIFFLLFIFPVYCTVTLPEGLVSFILSPGFFLYTILTFCAALFCLLAFSSLVLSGTGSTSLWFVSQSFPVLSRPFLVSSLIPSRPVPFWCFLLVCFLPVPSRCCFLVCILPVPSRPVLVSSSLSSISFRPVSPQYVVSFCLRFHLIFHSFFSLSFKDIHSFYNQLLHQSCYP